MSCIYGWVNMMHGVIDIMRNWTHTQCHSQRNCVVWLFGKNWVSWSGVVSGMAINVSNCQTPPIWKK